MCKNTPFGDLIIFGEQRFRNFLPRQGSPHFVETNGKLIWGWEPVCSQLLLWVTHTGWAPTFLGTCETSFSTQKGKRVSPRRRVFFPGDYISGGLFSHEGFTPQQGWGFGVKPSLFKTPFAFLWGTISNGALWRRGNQRYLCSPRLFFSPQGIITGQHSGGLGDIPNSKNYSFVALANTTLSWGGKQATGVTPVVCIFAPFVATPMGDLLSVPPPGGPIGFFLYTNWETTPGITKRGEGLQESIFHSESNVFLYSRAHP